MRRLRLLFNKQTEGKEAKEHGRNGKHPFLYILIHMSEDNCSTSQGFNDLNFCERVKVAFATIILPKTYRHMDNA